MTQQQAPGVVPFGVAEQGLGIRLAEPSRSASSSAESNDPSPRQLPARIRPKDTDQVLSVADDIHRSHCQELWIG